MKNYGDLGGCCPPSSISIILHKILSLIHYLLIIPRGRVGYEMIDSQLGATRLVGYNHFISNSIDRRLDRRMASRSHRVQRKCICCQKIKTRRKPLIALEFRYTFYRPQTKRLSARKIGLQYKILRATCRAPARIWLAVIDFQKSIWVR